ncbi:TraG family conjugative transposon ATPase [Mucilaginibacter sp. UYCu711]|uniref:TraG family conjugative transposon ATPase n=1 Tax=Mucilaginibacter sp. UYCu711 TaxID=3156339 RepID=UPI003D2618D4
MPQKNEFKLPYLGTDTYHEYDLLYGAKGEFSVVIEITNPIVRYAASPVAYDEFHSIFTSLVKILGDGYLLQKQDIFSKAKYPYRKADDYLQDKYNAHFEGREYTQISTYLTVTKQPKKGHFYVYDPKVLQEFRQAVTKVVSILEISRCRPSLLKKHQVNKLMISVLAMDFSRSSLVLNNIRPTDTELQMGNRSTRCITLVNADNVDLPSEVSTHVELNDKDTMKGFPVDVLNFLHQVPGYETIIYNQVIEIPSQQMTLNKLEVKKKRHSGIPDPANQLCVEDIDHLLRDVARDNQLLVQAHFNIMVTCKQEHLQRAANFIENALFSLGIIVSKNAYNQLELFRTALPGNGVEIQNYDWFLTTCDAALCLFFKESLPKDDPSKFLVHFTDRQGIPIGIDLSDLMMRTGRISNRNRFVLGGSGTGKSFFINSLVEQYLLYNMDVVIVDVGHSYTGLNQFKNGKYITYTEEKPITMNPFQIKADEYNIEKKDFLVTLTGLLWKGADGTISTVERDVISNIVSSYYNAYFNPEITDGQSRSSEVTELNFNSFYDFALYKVPVIKSEDHIPFDLDEFRYVLKKFYRGGEYDTILNEAADESLFFEPFIIYEIDNVKDNKVLFPICTLIIMDVFIQKMRHRKDRRKTLILEEAWKALASPIMAEFLLYLNKTVRKFWGEIIEVTQELGDILSNPIVKDSIINNSDTVILLDQSKALENFKEVAKLLSITETEQRKIFTTNQLDNKENRGMFKEVYIRRGQTGEVYGVEVSIEQYLVYTTEKPEKSAVEIYTRHYGKYTEGLDAFVADYRQSGKSLTEFVTAVNTVGKPII